MKERSSCKKKVFEIERDMKVKLDQMNKRRLK